MVIKESLLGFPKHARPERSRSAYRIPCEHYRNRNKKTLFVGNLRLLGFLLPQWKDYMLWTIFVVLIVLWLLGFIGHLAGGFIHLLLVIAVIVLIIRLVQGRAP